MKLVSGFIGGEFGTKQLEKSVCYPTRGSACNTRGGFGIWAALPWPWSPAQLDGVFRANRRSWSPGKGWDWGLFVINLALQSQVSPGSSVIMVWAHPQSTRAPRQDPVTVTITAPALLDKGAGTDAETTAAAPSSHITPQGLSRPCVCTQENLNFSGPPFSQHCPVQEKFPLVIFVNFFFYSILSPSQHKVELLNPFSSRSQVRDLERQKLRAR